MIRPADETPQRRGRPGSRAAGQERQAAAAAPASPAPPTLPSRGLPKAQRALQQLQLQPQIHQGQQQQPMGPSTVGTIGAGVEIRPSSIPAAGNGLFAGRAFARGELITEYEGSTISHLEAQLLRAQGRHTHIRVLSMQHAYLDGLKTPKLGAGGGSFANDSRDSVTINSVYDTRFDRRTARSRVYLRALRDIAAGEEVFVSYGSDYWRSFEKLAAAAAAAAPAAAAGSSGGRAGLRRAASRTASSSSGENSRAGPASRGAARGAGAAAEEALSAAAKAFADMIARAQARSERAGRRELARSGSDSTSSGVGKSSSGSVEEESAASAPSGTRPKRHAAPVEAVQAEAKRKRTAPGSKPPQQQQKQQQAAAKRTGGEGSSQTGETPTVRVLKPRRSPQQQRQSPPIRRIAEVGAAAVSNSSRDGGSCAHEASVAGARRHAREMLRGASLRRAVPV